MEYEFAKRCIIRALEDTWYTSNHKSLRLIDGENAIEAVDKSINKVFHEFSLFRDVEMEKLKIKIFLYEEIIKKSNFSVMVLD